MGNFYDDSKFGVVQRKWFGLTLKWGGDSPTDSTEMEIQEAQKLNIASWYPKGPIDIHKVGAMTLGTLGKGEQLYSIGIDGTATVMATVVSSTTSAPSTIASKSVTDSLSAGSYLTILASTNVCSTGTVALFVDWSPSFDSTGKWDV